MAKQSGIHQLRGKVGEHSYYRQTGVPGGLVRAINPAMSSRVKTDPAYANTRLNNAEFGQAGRIASVLARFITPKFRPMVLPFSQSKMAKIILEYLKTDDGEWGQRNLSAENIPPASITALNLVSKNRFDDFGLSISLNTENTTGVLTVTEATEDYLLSIGANGLDLTLVFAEPWVGNFLPSDGKYFNTYGRATKVTYTNISSEGTTNLDFSEPTPPPSGWPVTSGLFTIAIILPYRDVNDSKFYLQEYCTYKAGEYNDGEFV